MKILGIDPGLRTTGFGVIHKQGQKLTYVASGTIKTVEGSLPERLKTILSGVSEIVRTYQPDCAAIEKVFVNVNPQSTLLLGQARGAAICALVAADLMVAEYTAAGQARGCRPGTCQQRASAGYGATSVNAIRHTKCGCR
jgi:crossover junction endodeoxyribonuclease RuvC